MHTIGIDYQGSSSLIYLREGDGVHSRLRPISDGHREHIPHAATADGAWGSQALRQLARDAPYEPRAEEDVWTGEPGAALYWRGLADRLYRYLGRLWPTARNGYRVVISVPTSDPDTLAAVERLARAAGLSDALCITAPDALCCRWLAAQPSLEAGTSSVVAVMVGDAVTMLSGYRVRHDGSRVLSVARAAMSTRSLPIGLTHWNSALLERVHALAPERLPEQHRLVLRDAAVEFGKRLARSSPRQALRWTGPFHEQLYARLELTPDECANWEATREMARALPDLLQAVLPKEGRAAGTHIAIGGVGTAWPFANAAVASLGTVWRSATAFQDLAVGAAWWPTWAEVLSHGGGMATGQIEDADAPRPAPRRARPAAEPTATMGDDAAPRKTIVPPWER